jgi:rhodanese-related sulfurtransferase
VRIGFDHTVGHVRDVEGYLLAHQDRVEQASRLTPYQVELFGRSLDLQVVDIRNEGELAEGRIPGSVHIPLAELARRKGELDLARPTVVYCAGGWRSSVGASLLRAAGFIDVSDILGGYAGWDAAQRLSA